MSATPLVSIALCTRNGARFLPQQLDSLLAQSHRPLELVAADDASSDASYDIVQDAAHRFERSRLFRNPAPMGVQANFEQVFRACTGDWIAPCDQDDIWAPGKLARLIEAAGDAAVVYCDSALIDAQGRSMNQRMSDSLVMVSGNRPRAFSFYNCASGHAMLFRRELLAHALPIPDGVHYDWWLAFVASNHGGLRYVDEPLVQFRRHADTATPFARWGRLRRSPLERHRVHTRDLEALADYAGPDQAFFRRLLQLWQEREQRWFAPALAQLMARHHGELHLPDKAAARRSDAWYAWKFLFGLRAKMLVWNARHKGART
jgi:glycosyltransferase involved in cell wall biosynthesis